MGKEGKNGPPGPGTSNPHGVSNGSRGVAGGSRGGPRGIRPVPDTPKSRQTGSKRLLEAPRRAPKAPEPSPGSSQEPPGSLRAPRIWAQNVGGLSKISIFALTHRSSFGERPRLPRVPPKTAPRTCRDPPKMALRPPGTPKDSPKSPPGHATTAPRLPKIPPRRLHELPCSPKILHDNPKIVQDPWAPSREPHGSPREPPGAPPGSPRDLPGPSRKTNSGTLVGRIRPGPGRLCSPTLSGNSSFRGPPMMKVLGKGAETIPKKRGGRGRPPHDPAGTTPGPARDFQTLPDVPKILPERLRAVLQDVPSRSIQFPPQDSRRASQDEPRMHPSGTKHPKTAAKTAQGGHAAPKTRSTTLTLL